jgi:hypothetical protein
VKTTYQKNQDIGYAFGKIPFTVPDTYYMGLSTSSDTTVFTELSTTGYSRIAYTNNTTNFTTPDNGTVKNAISVDFPEAIDNWDSVYAIGIFDSMTGGNLLYIATLDTPVTVQKESILRFKPEAIELTETDVVDDD